MLRPSAFRGSCLVLAAALGACSSHSTVTPTPTADSPATTEPQLNSLVEVGQFEGTVHPDGSVELHPYTGGGDTGRAVQALSVLDRTANNFTLTQAPTASVNSRTTCSTTYGVDISGVASGDSVRCATITVTNNNAPSGSNEYATGNTSGLQFNRTYVELTYLSDSSVIPLGTEGNDGFTGFLSGSPGHWFAGTAHRSGSGADTASFTMAYSTPTPSGGGNYGFNIRVRVLADVVRPVEVASVVAATGATTDTGVLSARPGISSDGRYVVWLANVTSDNAPVSPGSDADSSTFTYQVFRRDLQTRTTTCVTTLPSGLTGSVAGDVPVISPDGQWVLFVSSDSGYAGSTGSKNQIIARDMSKAPGASGAFVLISKNLLGLAGGNDLSARPAISGSSGAYNVTYQSKASNLTLDSTTTTAKILYCSFDGTSCSSTELVSRVTGSGSSEMLADSPGSAVSSSGQYVVFLSSGGGLGTGVTGPTSTQYWVRDRTNATTLLMSGIVSSGTPTYFTIPTPNYQPFISADGSYLTFPLVGPTFRSGLGNAATYHVIERHLTGSDASSTSGWLIPSTSSTTSVVYSVPTGISSDGRYVAFLSNDGLIAADTNGGYDQYSYDRVTASSARRLQLATVHVDGAAEPSGSSVAAGALSSNGLYLAIYDTAATLVSGVTSAHVYVAPIP